MKGSELFLKTNKTPKSNRGIIVGFDPGLTVGIAIINLKGDLLSLTSFKEITRSDVVSHIISYGKTVLIATDVYPPPKTVRKLASILNSKIRSPFRSMSVESKINIVDSFLQSIDNPVEIPQNAHERDALAAAVKTYRDLQNKFRQIDKRTEKLELSDDAVDIVKIMVINGTSISNAIEQVFLDMKNNETEYVTKQSLNIQDKSELENHDLVELNNENVKNDNIPKQDSESARISKMQNKINSQKRQINHLLEKNHILEDEILVYRSEISKLQSKLDKLNYHYTQKILEKKELSSKVVMIKRLQKKYSQEKARRKELEQKMRSAKDVDALAMSENVLPVKIIESFTKEGIREACNRWKIKIDDIILLKNSEGGGSNTASMITDLGVKAVITMDKISDPAEEILKDMMIPIIPADNVEINYMHEFAIVNSDTINAQIKLWKDRVDNQKKTEDKKKLLNLVDEYRAQRRRTADR